MKFPKGPTTWMGADNTAYYSIPFTWNLPQMAKVFQNVDIFVDRIVVGGPAVRLMPHYFDDTPYVRVDLGDIPGVMQKVNPLATKTSVGCIRKCEFCAVPKTEGTLKELKATVYRYSGNLNISPKGNVRPVYLDEFPIEKCLCRL